MTRAKFIRIASWVAVIHAAVVGGGAALLWNAATTEIGPPWFFVFLLFDFPTTYLVSTIDALPDGPYGESEASQIIFAAILLATGTLQWVGIVIGSLWVNHVVHARRLS